MLPKQGTSGLPLTTVNLEKLKLRLLRVNERNLVPSIDAERLTMSFSSYEIDEIINRTGSLVWEGEMAVAGERNRPVTTAIPLKDMLHEKGPGIYLAVAERTDLMQDQYAEPATNWVLVSDLGLAAYKGTDGLAVDVRSLADGKPMTGVAVRLYARNNGELPAATSDAGGIAKFPGGLLRGRGGDEPFVLTAHGPKLRAARVGPWPVELLLDPKAPPIGSAEFRVEDFVPPQLKVALAAGDGPIRPGEVLPVDVDPRYYYGAPGAGLAIEAEAVIALDENSFPMQPGFHSAWSTRNLAGTAATSKPRRPTRTARRGCRWR